MKITNFPPPPQLHPSDEPGDAFDQRNPLEPLEPLDRESLLQRFGGQPAIVERVLREFVKEIPVTLTELEQSVEAGDGVRARQVAHKLFGGLRTLCAEPAAALAEVIEEAVQGDLEKARTLIPQLREKLAQLETLAKSLYSL